MNQPTRRPQLLPPALAKALDDAREALLSVHKALLDEERTRYEREVGPVGSAGHFLQLVIRDPWFAWLHPMTELVVQIDELVAAREPAPDGTGEALVEQARRLLSPSVDGDAFQSRYQQALQVAPAVVLAHFEAVRRIRSHGTDSRS